MKRRIALVCPGYQAGAHGGVERVARWMYDCLTGVAGLEVDLVSLATSSIDADSSRLREPRSLLRGAGRSSSEVGGIEVQHFGAHLVEIEPARYLPRRQLTAHLDRYDLVQVVAGTPAFALAATAASTPVLLQAATTVARERRTENLGTGVEARYRKAMTTMVSHLERRALRRVSHTFVSNTWFEAVCSAISSPEAVTLAPPGVDTDLFTPRAGPPDEPYILSVGRLCSGRKNFAGLVRSYGLAVRELGLTQPLVIAGAGPIAPELTSMVSTLGLRDAVRFEVDVDEERLRTLFRDASFFALASHEEGLGIVFLEALASGLPILATASEGATEVISRSGVGRLVPVFSGASEEFAAGLVTCASLASRGDERDRSREAAVREFSNDVAIDRFLAVYEKVWR